DTRAGPADSASCNLRSFSTTVALCASTCASSCGLEMRAMICPASTAAPSRTVSSTILPSRLEEMSTVSPSMRPLTKRVPFSALLVVLAHPPRTRGMTITSKIHFRFIAPSLALLAVGFLSESGGARQVGPSQPQGVHGSHTRIIGFRNAVLRVHDFGVVGHTLGKSLACQFHFLPR